MNNLDVFEIFSTPIGVFKYHDEKYLGKNIEKYLKENNPSHNGHSQELKHYGDDHGSSVLNNNIFGNFKKWVLECGMFYSTEVLGYNIPDKLIITESWINVANKGAYQFPHLHVNSFISGTYYVNRNNNHSPIFFKHPKNIEFNGNKPILLMGTKKQTKFNTDVKIEPANGTLVLWESFVVHGYDNNMSDNRIALSMNMMPNTVTNGRYGYKVSEF
jgi:uncharacterized protein (TIGR02466 family)